MLLNDQESRLPGTHEEDHDIYKQEVVHFHDCLPAPSWPGCLETLTGGFWTPVVTRKHLLEGAGIDMFRFA